MVSRSAGFARHAMTLANEGGVSAHTLAREHGLFAGSQFR